MKLDEYINALEELRKEVGGDVRVVTSAGSLAPLHAIRDSCFASIETLQVKNKRESYEKIFRGAGYGKTPAVDSGVKVILL